MKKILLSTSSAVIASILFTGCGIKTAEYNPSADNVSKLRTYEGLKLGIGAFSAKDPGQSSSMCRMAETITTPTGESFEKYIENAITSELKMANLYDENAPIKIKGHIKEIYGSTMLGDAYWKITLTISSTNGKSFEVDTKREYPSAFLAYTACNNMASSFSPTVRQLVNDIINHKEFNSLVRS